MRYWSKQRITDVVYAKASITRQHGLSLIELMCVLVIVAILGAIALPSYLDYLKRSRRSDAIIALERVANEQEKFFFDHQRYAPSFSSLNIADISPDGFYSLTMVTIEEGYVATATPVAGGGQHGDGVFSLGSNGKQGWDPGHDGIYECTWRDAARTSPMC